MFQISSIHHDLVSDGSCLKDCVTDHATIRPCGLVNFGESCYANSALQCLIHIDPLTKSLFHLRERLEDLHPLTKCYLELLNEMWVGERPFVSAQEIQDRVSENHPRFGDRSQQDSHEFLCAFLETLHEELSLCDDSTPCTIVDNITSGSIKSTITCLSCEQSTSTYDTFTTLALPLAVSQATAFRWGGEQGFLSVFAWLFSYVETVLSTPDHLTKCFELIFRKEPPSGCNQWFCSVCNRLTDICRKVELWTLPKILILQLKRFPYDLSNNTKIQTYIDYPLDLLDLSEFMHNPEADKTIRYDLVAVSVHQGRVDQGHYITYARNPLTKRWRMFNDQHVSEMEARTVVSRDAYMLVYVQHSL